MKKISISTYDDCSMLEELSTNDQLCSYPRLRYVLDNILGHYSDYDAHEGDPWNISPLGIVKPLKDNLIYHFNHPPNALNHIDVLRDEGSPDVCPMCGSLKTGTLDHVLPKSAYPEFAVFSKNLVPACDCNSLRDNAYKGTSPGQRAIHPYFDNFMNIRLVRSLIEGRLECPCISLVVCCGNIPQIETVNFHIEKVVLKTKIVKFLEAKWSVMIRKPQSMLMNLEDGVVTENNVRSSVERMLNFYDNQLSTPNNWFSIFYAGIFYTTGVTAWLTTRINDIYRGDIIPD